MQILETDTHWKTTKGFGSFNWRMVFNITLPTKDPYFSISM
jgi:hypothetical protein